MKRTIGMGLTWLTLAGAALAQPADPARKFAVIQGKVVTCKEAWDYRNGPLVRQYDILTSASEQEREARRKKIIAETNKHIDDLKTKIAAADKKKKREIAYALGMQAVAKIIDGYASGYLKKSGLSETDKKYADEAIKKSVEMQTMIVNAAFEKAPDPKALLATKMVGILALVFPPAKPAEKVLEWGLFGIDVAALMGELYQINQDYDVQVEPLRELIAKLVANSSSVKIADVNRVKNEIDAACK